MPEGADGHAIQIDRFFAGPGARGDQWRNLVELAEAGDRAKFDTALGELAVTEAFHAYPGPQLLAALRNNKSDTHAIAALARRIPRTLLTGAYRQNAGEWTEEEDENAVTADVLPPTLGRTEAHRPYFEVLIVTGAPAARWAALATEWRRLRRPLDAFIYEPVFVGSFEDAFCAAMLNTESRRRRSSTKASPFRSRHDAPILRSLIEAADQQRERRTLGTAPGAGAEARAAGARSLPGVQRAASRRSPASPRRRRCAASSMPSRSCSNCTSPSSRACRTDTTRRSSTT